MIRRNPSHRGCRQNCDVTSLVRKLFVIRRSLPASSAYCFVSLVIKAEFSTSSTFRTQMSESDEAKKWKFIKSHPIETESSPATQRMPNLDSISRNPVITSRQTRTKIKNRIIWVLVRVGSRFRQAHSSE